MKSVQAGNQFSILRRATNSGSLTTSPWDFWWNTSLGYNCSFISLYMWNLHCRVPSIFNCFTVHCAFVEFRIFFPTPTPQIIILSPLRFLWPSSPSSIPTWNRWPPSGRRSFPLRWLSVWLLPSSLIPMCKVSFSYLLEGKTPNVVEIGGPFPPSIDPTRCLWLPSQNLNDFEINFQVLLPSLSALWCCLLPQQLIVLGFGKKQDEATHWRKHHRLYHKRASEINWIFLLYLPCFFLPGFV